MTPKNKKREREEDTILREKTKQTDINKKESNKIYRIDSRLFLSKNCKKTKKQKKDPKNIMYEEEEEGHEGGVGDGIMIRLSIGEKLLNQRFLAERCITEQRAKEIWKNLYDQGKFNDDHNNNNTNTTTSSSSSSCLEDSLMKCNAALELANSNLEIVGIVFPHPTTTTTSSGSTPANDSDDNNDDNDQQSDHHNNNNNNKKKTTTTTTTKYLAMIHKHTPQQQQQITATTSHEQHQSPSQLAFVKSCLGGPIAMKHRRIIFEYLVQHTIASRSTLINLKNQVVVQQQQQQQTTTTTTTTNPIINYTLSMAENCVDEMIQDKWLFLVGTTDHNNNNNKENNQKKNRRISMNTQIALSPRTFMELSHVLTEQLGMDENKLPQQLFYR